METRRAVGSDYGRSAAAAAVEDADQLLFPCSGTALCAVPLVALAIATVTLAATYWVGYAHSPVYADLVFISMVGSHPPEASIFGFGL